MRYNEQDLIGLSDSVGDKNNASYCLDISNPATRQQFAEFFSKKLMLDGKMELPDLPGLLELVTDLKEQFSEQITLL